MASNPLNTLVQEVLNTPSESPLAVQGAGSGLSDSVPATIDGEQPAALSQGEFVFPADVVSFMGNGSTDAGAKVLNEIVLQVRSMMKQGGEEQAPPIEEQISKAKTPKK